MGQVSNENSPLLKTAKASPYKGVATGAWKENRIVPSPYLYIWYGGSAEGGPVDRCIPILPVW